MKEAQLAEIVVLENEYETMSACVFPEIGVGPTVEPDIVHMPAIRERRCQTFWKAWARVLVE